MFHSVICVAMYLSVRATTIVLNCSELHVSRFKLNSQLSNRLVVPNPSTLLVIILTVGVVIC